MVMPPAVELSLLRIRLPLPVMPPVTERFAVLPLWLLTSDVPALFIAMAPTVRFDDELFCVMRLTFDPTPPLIVTLPVPLPELVMLPVPVMPPLTVRTPVPLLLSVKFPPSVVAPAVVVLVPTVVNEVFAAALRLPSEKMTLLASSTALPVIDVDPKARVGAAVKLRLVGASVALPMLREPIVCVIAAPEAVRSRMTFPLV